MLQGLNFILDSNSEAFVEDSYFMTYHSTVIKSNEFIAALKRSREIGDEIKQHLIEERGINVEFFSYR